jgi:hypothetical protein
LNKFQEFQNTPKTKDTTQPNQQIKNHPKMTKKIVQKGKTGGEKDKLEIFSQQFD